MNDLQREKSLTSATDQKAVARRMIAEKIKEIQAMAQLTDGDLCRAFKVNDQAVPKWRKAKAYPIGQKDREIADLHYIFSEKSRVLHPSEVRFWFFQPSRSLGGVSPENAITNGNIDAVRSWVSAESKKQERQPEPLNRSHARNQETTDSAKSKDVKWFDWSEIQGSVGESWNHATYVAEVPGGFIVRQDITHWCEDEKQCSCGTSMVFVPGNTDDYPEFARFFIDQDD